MWLRLKATGKMVRGIVTVIITVIFTLSYMVAIIVMRVADCSAIDSAPAEPPVSRLQSAHCSVITKHLEDGAGTRTTWPQSMKLIQARKGIESIPCFNRSDQTRSLVNCCCQHSLLQTANEAVKGPIRSPNSPGVNAAQSSAFRTSSWPRGAPRNPQCWLKLLSGPQRPRTIRGARSCCDRASQSSCESSRFHLQSAQARPRA